MAAGPGGAIAALRRLAREIFPSRQAAEQFARDEWDLVYFVSSEHSAHGSRAYSVRSFNCVTADIDTVGDFQQYPTKARAFGAAKRIAA